MYDLRRTSDGLVTLVAPRASATIAPARGGLLTDYTAHGERYLYLDAATFADPSANVRGGVPVLFPSPGRLPGDRYLAGGAPRALPQHGFARRLPFTEIAASTEEGASITLALTTPAREDFPFAVTLTLAFTLTEDALTVLATAANDGPHPAPCAIGFHPYFAVDQAAKGALTVPHRATRAYDNRRRVAVPAPPVLRFDGPEELDLHLLDDPDGEKVLLRDGAPWLAIALDGPAPPVWVFWALPNRDFVCVEPWSAPGGALVTGDRLDLLPPGASRTRRLRFRPLGRDSGGAVV